MRRLPNDVVEGDRITMSGYSKDDFTKKIARLKRDHPNFAVVEQHEETESGGQVAVTMVQDPAVWPRFAAKTALATASLVAADEWLDTPAARELREVLWSGPPVDAVAEPGVGWCALPLQLPSAFPLQPPEHLLAFEAGGFAIVVFGELLYRIRGFEWEWTGDEPPLWAQSWWFSPEEPKARRLPTQVQYGFLGMRFEKG